VLKVVVLYSLSDLRMLLSSTYLSSVEAIVHFLVMKVQHHLELFLGESAILLPVGGGRTYAGHPQVGHRANNGPAQGDRTVASFGQERSHWLRAESSPIRLACRVLEAC
jgi:hypothetical protein